MYSSLSFSIYYLMTILIFYSNIILAQNFGEFDMWLAAENGMFLSHTKGDWMTTMPEHLNMEWVDSVKVLKTKFYALSSHVVLLPSNSLR